MTLYENDINSNDLFQQSVIPFPKSVYIVIGTFSNWDSYHERNLRAFYDMETAEKYAEKANRILKAMSQHIAKMNIMQYLDRPEYEDMEVKDIIAAQDLIADSAEFKLAVKVWSAHMHIQEFNECKIQEIKIQ